MPLAKRLGRVIYCANPRQISRRATGSLGGIAVPILVGLLLQHLGGYAAVLGFFALCSAAFIAGTLLISLDKTEAKHG